MKNDMMNQQTSRRIWLYAGADAGISIALRCVQFYYAWNILQINNKPQYLSMLFSWIWALSAMFLPIAGFAAERWSKDLVLLAVALLALCTAVLATAGVADLCRAPTLMLGVAFLAALAMALQLPLGTPLLAELAQGRDSLHRAMRIRSLGLLSNYLFGPALAGILIAHYGGLAVLLISNVAACTACGLATSLRWARPRLGPCKVNSPWQRSAHTTWTRFKSAAHRILQIRAERDVALASLLANAVFVPFVFLLLPARVLELGGSMQRVGLLELSIGMGVIASACFFLNQAQKFGDEHRLVVASMALLALAMSGLALSASSLAMLAWTFLSGVALSSFNATVNARRAACIPVEHCAMMESALMVICIAGAPLGFLVWTALLHWIGIAAAMHIGASVLGLCAASMLVSRPLRNMLIAGDGAEAYYLVQYRQLFIEE